MTKAIDKVRIDADWRCEFIDLRPGLGRCARGGHGVDVHHIKYRSHGGEDVEDNLLPVCRYHHDQIHANQLKGPYFDDEDGNTYYEFWDNYAQEHVRLFLWREKEQSLETRAIEADKVINSLFKARDETTWMLAEWLDEMDRFCLYSVLGYDSLGEYAAASNRSEQWVRKLIKAHNLLMQLPPEQRTKFRTMPVSIMTEAGAAILKLTPTNREGLVDMVQDHGVPTAQVIERARELARSSGKRNEHYKRFEVTLTIGAAAVMTVTATTKAEAVAKVRRNLNGYKPIRNGFQVHSSHVERLEDE